MTGLRLLSQIALVWAGIVIGCSFIATTAKFRAPSLSLNTAIEVGRSTFRAMVGVEVVLAIIAVTLMARNRQPNLMFWMAVLILISQWFVVMPFLNDRTDAILQGRQASGPPWHIAYILLEVTKVVLLLVLAFQSIGPRDPN